MLRPGTRRSIPSPRRSPTLNDHPGEAGTLLNIIAGLEHARNRDDEAERYYSRALLLLRQAHERASVDAALVEANLGFVRLDARQYESAEGLFRQAISEIEIASGPESPVLVRPLVNLARCENMSNHPNDAETVARRAVNFRSRSSGRGTPSMQLRCWKRPQHCAVFGIRSWRAIWKNTQKVGCERISRIVEVFIRLACVS